MNRPSHYTIIVINGDERIYWSFHSPSSEKAEEFAKLLVLGSKKCNDDSTVLLHRHINEKILINNEWRTF